MGAYGTSSRTYMCLFFCFWKYLKKWGVYVYTNIPENIKFFWYPPYIKIWGGRCKCNRKYEIFYGSILTFEMERLDTIFDVEKFSQQLVNNQSTTGSFFFFTGPISRIEHILRKMRFLRSQKVLNSSKIFVASWNNL